MKKTLLSVMAIALLSMVIFSFNSCKKTRRGVVEVKSYQGKGVYHYSVDVNEEPWGAQKSGEVFRSSRGSITNENVYWEDKSARSLGYTETNEGQWFYNKQGKAVPGKGGYWANGGGGANTPGFCVTAYVDPYPADYQISSQCESAFTYRCSGYDVNSQQVQYVCSTYTTFQASTPSIPDCSYCKP